MQLSALNHSLSLKIADEGTEEWSRPMRIIPFQNHLQEKPVIKRRERISKRKENRERRVVR